MFDKYPQEELPQVKMITKMMQAVALTEDDEFSCDDVYKLIDQYAEMLSRGEPVEEAMPLIEHHLRLCADCKEELEALLEVLDSMNSP